MTLFRRYIRHKLVKQAAGIPVDSPEGPSEPESIKRPGEVGAPIPGMYGITIVPGTIPKSSPIHKRVDTLNKKYPYLPKMQLVGASPTVAPESDYDYHKLTSSEREKAGPISFDEGTTGAYFSYQPSYEKDRLPLVAVKPYTTSYGTFNHELAHYGADMASGVRGRREVDRPGDLQLRFRNFEYLSTGAGMEPGSYSRAFSTNTSMPYSYYVDPTFGGMYKYPQESDYRFSRNGGPYVDRWNLTRELMNLPDYRVTYDQTKELLDAEGKDFEFEPVTEKYINYSAPYIPQIMNVYNDIISGTPSEEQLPIKTEALQYPSDGSTVNWGAYQSELLPPTVSDKSRFNWWLEPEADDDEPYDNTEDSSPDTTDSFTDTSEEDLALPAGVYNGPISRVIRRIRGMRPSASPSSSFQPKTTGVVSGEAKSQPYAKEYAAMAMFGPDALRRMWRAGSSPEGFGEKALEAANDYMNPATTEEYFKLRKDIQSLLAQPWTTETARLVNDWGITPTFMETMDNNVMPIRDMRLLKQQLIDSKEATRRREYMRDQPEYNKYNRPSPGFVPGGTLNPGVNWA